MANGLRGLERGETLGELDIAKLYGGWITCDGRKEAVKGN